MRDAANAGPWRCSSLHRGEQLVRAEMQPPDQTSSVTKMDQSLNQVVRHTPRMTQTHRVAMQWPSQTDCSGALMCTLLATQRS